MSTASLVSILGARRIWTPYKRIGSKKPPTDLHRDLLVDWSNPTHEFWTYDESRAAANRLKLPGVGLFTDGDLGALGDRCIVGGDVLPAARRILERLNTYTERSPSDTGVHSVFFTVTVHTGGAFRRPMSNGMPDTRAGPNSTRRGTT